MLFAENRKMYGVILVNEDDLDNKGSQAFFAAKELRYYLGRMTTVSFPIEADDGVKAGIAISRIDSEEMGTDGFAINTENNRITIEGGIRGVIYGAYELLEMLGCRFFTSSCEKIPTRSRLEIPEIHIKQKPVLEYREHSYADLKNNPRFSAKCRFNGNCHHIPQYMGGNMSYAWFVHSFSKLVPVEIYGKTHPEYYSMVNGERVVDQYSRTQLCLTNKDVLRISIESVRKALKEHPEARIISISQNDWDNHCTCENCRALDEKENSPSGSLLTFVNAIAEALEPEFPDVIFDTLAYLYSRPAPNTVRNRKNVCVRLCSIEACFAHPFETCDDETRKVKRPDGSSYGFIDDLRAWGKICDRMYIWDYTTCFAHYPTPHPNWRVLQKNVKAMVKNNVKGVFEQACGASKGNVDFNELRAYLISKLLWNPDCDIEAHKKEFMEYYYGAAAPALMEYLNLICDTVEKENIHVGFNDNPIHAYLTEDRLDVYDRLFDKAAEAVKGDPLRLWRVEKNRLSIRWVRLKRAAMLRNEYDPETINQFFADWRAYDLSRIDEWCNVETTHRALLEGKWRGVEFWEHWTNEDPEVF